MIASALITTIVTAVMAAALIGLMYGPIPSAVSTQNQAALQQIQPLQHIPHLLHLLLGRVRGG